MIQIANPRWSVKVQAVEEMSSKKGRNRSPNKAYNTVRNSLQSRDTDWTRLIKSTSPNGSGPGSGMPQIITQVDQRLSTAAAAGNSVLSGTGNAQDAAYGTMTAGFMIAKRCVRTN